MESQTQKWIFDFETIKQETFSDKQEIRGRAMQQLLMQARKNPAIQPAALEVFRAGLTAQDYWTAGNATRGIELIAGPEEGRAAWLTLLGRSPVEMVANVASILKDPFYVPALINLLEVRPELRIRTSVIGTLGRMKDSSAFQTLVEHLAITELRPHAVSALADLGDARAIPELEPLLKDRTDAWPEDNHGPMLRVCDLAQTAITRLRAGPDVKIPGIPKTSQPEVLQYWNATKQSSTWTAYVKTHLAVFVPLAAAIFEIPWLIGIFFFILLTTGTFKPNRPATRLLDLIAMAPAVVGLMTGILVIARSKAHGIAQSVCLIVGCLLCGLFIFSFGWEFFH